MCTFRYGQRRRPLIPQDIQTNGTIGIDVGVVNLRRKTDLGRFEGVIGGKADGEEENTACIRRVTLNDRRLSRFESVTPKKKLTGPIIVACH